MEYIFLVIGLTFAHFGIKIIRGSVETSRENKESITWPSTKGLIIKKHLREFSNTLEQQPGEHIPKKYTYDITYEYYVENKKYKSSRINILNEKFATNQKSILENKYKEFSEGSEIDVFYKSNSPKNAVLERTISSSNIAFIYFIGGLFSVIGIAGVAFFLHLKGYV